MKKWNSGIWKWFFLWNSKVSHDSGVCTSWNRLQSSNQMFTVQCITTKARALIWPARKLCEKQKERLHFLNQAAKGIYTKVWKASEITLIGRSPVQECKKSPKFCMNSMSLQINPLFERICTKKNRGQTCDLWQQWNGLSPKGRLPKSTHLEPKMQWKTDGAEKVTWYKKTW